MNVSTNGSTSDSTGFNPTELKTGLEDNTLGLPTPRPYPGDVIPIPYFMIGDNAFPLRQWMMKPFTSRHLTDDDRIFNNQLSRASHIVENAFGILASRFRCLLSTLQHEIENVNSIVIALVNLHNLMLMQY